MHTYAICPIQRAFSIAIPRCFSVAAGLGERLRALSVAHRVPPEVLAANPAQRERRPDAKEGPPRVAVGDALL